ncbi:MAG: protein translocase subunit SecF [Eubacteriaceae bacterium]|jgi:preprotein translocase subunit SecF|nr:protein translocase subunit SecF [Eubacteriaceae bacterium]
MKNFRFVENRKAVFSISIALCAISLLMLLFRGFNVGIDFKGGTIANIELHQAFETADVKAIVDKFDTDATITTGGDAETIAVVSSSKDFSETEKQEMFNAFKEKYNLTEVDLLSFNNISATIGRDLQMQALYASALTIACMLLYISIRFRFWYGLAAVVCLLHDILIVLGFYSLFQLPVNSSFIAAILTILGYSINNVIIVFDRVRENLKKYYPSLEGMVNESVASSWTRSVNTTMTTVIAVFAIFVFGVAAVREFILPMLIGFAAGFYSSVFVAAPLWYVFDGKRHAAIIRVP